MDLDDLLSHTPDFRGPHNVINSLFARGFPEAVAAGGFFRDLALGITPPKDLDVFIAHRVVPVGETMHALSDALGATVRMEYPVGLYAGPDGDGGEVFCTLSVDATCMGAPIQIIVLQPGLSPQDRATRHDFGLCLAHMDSTGVVHAPEEFLKDIANRTCTLIHCETEKEHARSMRRWKRWQGTWAKEFTLVDETPWKGSHL